MKDYLKKLLYPKNYIVILDLFIIVISLFYLIYFDRFGKVEAYILYLIMTYSLVVICIKVYQVIKNKINKIINNNRYLKEYVNNHELRYKLSLLMSLIFNVIYALFKLITGILFKSVWFITFALYYILLVVVRANILKEEINDKSSLLEEYTKYRKTAVILLLTNVILTMIILIIVNQKIMNIYPNWIAITVAFYTFSIIYSAIYNLIKYRKYKSPLMSSAKVINVITSLVSLISLEIILIPTFGSNNIEFFEIMVMATGGGIALIIIIISLYMIIKSTEWINTNN